MVEKHVPSGFFIFASMTGLIRTTEDGLGGTETSLGCCVQKILFLQFGDSATNLHGILEFKMLLPLHLNTNVTFLG